MTNIKYELVTPTDENINLLEEIRYDAYGMNIKESSPKKSLHTEEMKKGKYLIFGCYLDNKIVGACYISKLHNTLYIEQLFILKKYQKNNLHLGSNLLKFVLTNKQIIEKHFNTTFNYSYLDNYNHTTNFYKNLGYEEENYHMKKRL